MRRFFFKFWQKYFVVIILSILLLTFFKPLFFDNKTLISSNFLVAFHNPWAPEKFSEWPQGVPYKPVGSDDLRIFYPQRSFTQEMLSKFQLPFWNPYSFSGNYHLGLSETGVLYPLFFIFSFVPQQIGWVILMVIQPVLAFIGMYLFLQLLFTRKIYSVFGAVVFGFSGLVLVRMVEGISVGHSFLWLPFALWAVESYIQKGNIRFLCFLLLVMIFSVFAGWFQFSFYVIGLAFVYSLWRVQTNHTKISKKYLLVFLPFLLLPLLVLPHIIPAFETFLLSPRGGITIAELQQHLMPLNHLFTLLYADYWGNPATLAFFGKSEYKEFMMFIGTIPFLLTFFSLHYFKNRIVQFFVFLVGITLVFGLDTPISQGLLFLKIPIISSFLPDRIFALTTVALSVLAAFGLQFIIESKNIFWNGRIFRLLIIFLLIAFLFNVFALLRGPIVTYIPFLEGSFLIPSGEREQGIQIRNMVLANFMIVVFFIILTFRRVLREKGVLLFLILLTVAGQLYFSYKYISFSEKNFIFPEHRIFSYFQEQGLYRFITAGDSFIMSEIPLFYRVYSPEGVSSMYPKRYGELVTHTIFSGEKQPVPRIETRINPSPEKLFLDNNIFLTRFMEIDGIKFVLVRRDDFTSPGKENKMFHENWKLAWEDPTWQIYAYNKVLPRYFWTDSFTVTTNDDELLSKLFAETQEPKNILLEENPGFIAGGTGEGEVILTEYSPNQITFRVQSETDGLVYLSDTYAPNFKAYVDDIPTKVLRANYAFRAVPVTKGDHTITLRYEDKLFWIGSIVSLTLLIGLLGAIIILMKKRVVVW